MRSFIPTYGIMETAKNTYFFVMEHMNVFWDIFKPLAPWIAILVFFDTLIETYALSPDPITGEDPEFGIGELIASYFYTCLIISWHRVVIHGPDNYVPMNPFKPKKSELVFLFMGFAIFIAIFLAVIFGLTIVARTIPILAIILAVPGVLLFIFLMIRFSFYFPAKATEKTIDLLTAFNLSKGYVIKLIAAPAIAMFKPVLLIIAYLLVVIAIMFGFDYILYLVMGENVPNTLSGPLFNALGYIIMLPIYLYFQPLLYIIGVTTLSNYYRHATGK